MFCNKNVIKNAVSKAQINKGLRGLLDPLKISLTLFLNEMAPYRDRHTYFRGSELRRVSAKNRG